MRALHQAHKSHSRKQSDSYRSTAAHAGNAIRRTDRLYTRRQLKKNSKVYLWRRFIFGIAALVTLAFIGKVLLTFFSVEYVSLEVSGNRHYTDAHIYDILGANLDNIITESEEQTAAYLKKNLSYIKDAYISKQLMKRMLTITVTEREPFALLEYRLIPKTSRRPAKTAFFVVDREGYVLESVIDEFALRRQPSVNKQMQLTQKPSGAAPSRHRQVQATVEKHHRMPTVLAVGDVLPSPGTAPQESELVLGLHILKTAVLREPELANQIRTVDARQAHKVKLEILGLAAQVWISEDAVETGLHHITLFLQQGHNHAAEIDTTANEKQTYLDARFQDALYWGRENR